MRTCSHCGAAKSPCWRRGPPEKPMLCNACGAHFLVKRSLDGYMPGQRTSSATTSGSSQPLQQRHSQNKRQKLQQVQQLQYQTDDDIAGSTASSFSAGSTVEQQDYLEIEQPAFVSSRNMSRLVACSVYEIDPLKDRVLRCKRTFETPDGGVVTVVRRMRKQLKPRASYST